MATLTMQGVADLAMVKRPVVSAWRARFANSPTPFPEPRVVGGGGRKEFDAAEVSHWLMQTGHGNNPEAGIESPLHDDSLAKILADLDRASLLLLLQQWYESDLRDLQPVELVALLEVADHGRLVEARDALDALEDSKLVDQVHRLAEAAFGGGVVLDRIMSAIISVEGAWSGEALTPAAERFFGGLLAELSFADGRVMIPHGIGGLILAGAQLMRSTEGIRSRMQFEAHGSQRGTPEVRAAWRRLAAHGAAVASEQGQGSRHLFLQQQVADAASFFAQVESLLLDLGEDDQLVVVGPAALMIGEQTTAARRQVLAPSPNYCAPLRYIARLPKGLSLTGGRMRLAIWVFGAPGAEWTVYGDHSGMDELDVRAIASDVSVALSNNASMRAHAFLRSAVRASDRYLRSDQLVVPVGYGSAKPGGERLARIWELDRGVLDGFEFEASESDVERISFARACREFGRDLPGMRIDPSCFEPPGPGTVTVIGPEEIRRSRAPRTRGVARLGPEATSPRVHLTEPGDVIYVTQGGIASMVDDEGGRIVLAPARIFRCLSRHDSERKLVPVVVASDIASMRSRDRRDWHLRTVQVSRAEVLESSASKIFQQRLRLLAELQRIDDLESEVIDGLADGTLIAGPARTTAATDSTKAE